MRIAGPVALTDGENHDVVGSFSGLVPENLERRLTAPEFQSLSDAPPEVEWFANIENPNTRRAYQNDLRDFMQFVGIRNPQEFRMVKRAHIITWRRRLEERALEPTTVRRKLSAIASLFDHLCEANAVPYNPADGVRRPSAGSNEGKSAALGDDQAKAILEAPSPDTLKGIRDRAILSALLFHGLRRAELCSLTVEDVCPRRGVIHFRVSGKGGKLRFVPVHAHTLGRINDYLDCAGHRGDVAGPLFRSMRAARTNLNNGGLSGNGVYKDVVLKYARMIGVPPGGVCVHGLRATAATNALDHDADIAKVQDWLGHANISTTRLYDRRRCKPEESPTFKVDYT